MRKCRSCGSLLLGEVERCGRCGTPLESVTAGAPASAAAPAPAPATPTAPSAAPPVAPAPAPAPAVRASGYGRLSIPPPGGVAATGPGGSRAPGAPATVPAAGALPPAGMAPLREQWQPVAISAPEPVARPKATRRGIIALVVVLAVAAGAVVMHLGSDPLPAGTSAYVAGGGVTYTSPDGAFQVQLPATPTTDQRTITEDSVTATIYTALQTTDNYEIGAASIVFPSSVLPDRINAALDAALAQGISGTNGKLVRKNLMMRDSLPAIEGEFKAPDGYRAHILVVARGATMILVAVHAKSGTDRLYKTLEASLLIR